MAARFANGTLRYSRKVASASAILLSTALSECCSNSRSNSPVTGLRWQQSGVEGQLLFVYSSHISLGCYFRWMQLRHAKLPHQLSTRRGHCISSVHIQCGGMASGRSLVKDRLVKRMASEKACSENPMRKLLMVQQSCQRPIDWKFVGASATAVNSASSHTSDNL